MTALEPPKRPQHAYQLFKAKNAQQIRQAATSGSATALSKVAGTLWAALDEEKKDAFKAKAASAKAEYAAELAAFKQSGGVVPARKSRASKGGKTSVTLAAFSTFELAAEVARRLEAGSEASAAPAQVELPPAASKRVHDTKFNAPESKKRKGDTLPFEEGAEVQAKFEGVYYAAVVKKVLTDGMYKVKFPDGTKADCKVKAV